MSTQWQLVVDCRALRPDQRELLAAELWDHPITGIEERADDVVVGFVNQADARSAARSLDVPSSVLEVIDDGYLDEWRRFAQPATVGRLYVRPAWVEGIRPEGATEIVIEPRRAFGSGAHASTRLTLALMQQHDLRGCTVLDIGCGSGILSVAACALGAVHVDAIDIDPFAIACTYDNARRNDVDDRVSARVATAHDLVERFDVALVNVLPSIHREIAIDVHRLTTHLVIVAGFLDAHADDIESAYAARRVGMLREAGWTALALRVDAVEPSRRVQG
jgi:ribosomal protein L11 methyltransferase